MKIIQPITTTIFIALTMILITGCTENKCFQCQQNQNPSSESEMKDGRKEELPLPPPPPPPDPSQQKMEDEQKIKEVANSSPAYSLSAVNLYKEWSSDCKPVKKKYDQKVIEIIGSVFQISINEENKSYVIAFLCGNDKYRDKLACYFSESQKDKLATISINSQITIKGLCHYSPDCPSDMFFNEMQLNYCMIP
jgi:hypothetical protein